MTKQDDAIPNIKIAIVTGGSRGIGRIEDVQSEASDGLLEKNIRYCSRWLTSNCCSVSACGVRMGSPPSEEFHRPVRRKFPLP